MAYIYFPNKDDVFHNDIEEFINGYGSLYDLKEGYSLIRIIGALHEAYNDQIRQLNEDSGWNHIAIISARKVVENAIEEVEEKYPREEYPELWL